MCEQYIPLISGFMGAIVGAGASLLAVQIQARYWYKQQYWVHREKYYCGLLSSLTKLKISLEDRAVYLDGPASGCTDSQEETDYFVNLSRTGDEALSLVREQIGAASVFLPVEAIAIIEKLLSDHWHVSGSSVCSKDYISSALRLVNKAHAAILNHAKGKLIDV